MDYETLVSGLKFDEKGLIPVVVQDYVTHEVLTLAYMNRESLKITLEEKRTCFYSRSRQCLCLFGFDILRYCHDIRYIIV